MNDATLRRIQRLENRRAELAGPVDGLSKSLWEYGKHLTDLDALGLTAEAAELEIPVDAVKQMQQSYRRPLWRV